MKLTRTIAGLCLSIQMCFLPAYGGGQIAVLCQGEDGRVAIEAAYNDSCAGTAEEACAPSAGRQFASNNSCGECVDVPLCVGSAMVFKEPHRVGPAVSGPTTAALAVANAADSTECHLAPEAFPPPYFTPLGSVILLI